MKKRYFKKIKFSEVNSNDVMKNGILIGCHHGLNDKDLNYIKKNFKIFINNIPR